MRNGSEMRLPVGHFPHECGRHLLPQVLMKDIVTPVPQEEVRYTIKKCLENAALVNYERVSAHARIEGNTRSLDSADLSTHPSRALLCTFCIVMFGCCSNCSFLH